MNWFSSWNCFSMFGECSMVFQSSPTELRVLKFPGGFYPCLVMKGTQKRCMVSLLLGWVVGSKPSWSCAPCLEKGWTVEGQWMGFEGACLFEGEGVTVVETTSCEVSRSCTFQLALLECTISVVKLAFWAPRLISDFRVSLKAFFYRDSLSRFIFKEI